jgi:hypothetical protein
MNSHDTVSYQLTKAYHGAMPGSLIAAERLHIAMGVESEAWDVYGQLVIIPWHIPLPRELQLQPRSGYSQHSNITADATMDEFDMSRAVGRQPQLEALPQHGKRRLGPSHRLERSLHNKTLALHLSAVEKEIPTALESRDANLPLAMRRRRYPIKTNELPNSTLKRKLSKVKLPSAPKDEPLSGDVPNLSAQPAYQHLRRISGCVSTSGDNKVLKNKSERPKAGEFEEKSESPSPPRRRSMPPIEAVLAHGFKNISIVRPIQSTTPRSHAYDPWTNLSFSHKVLSPTPAFLLNMTPFQYNDNEDTYYWKSSLPLVLSYHLANPVTLLEETPIQSLTFHLPPPIPTFASTANRRQPTRRQPHYKMEGPESNTHVRMIRMILPPVLLAETMSEQEVPFTDWMIFCLSDTTDSPPSTRVLRSASQIPKNPYLVITIPTHAIAETVFVGKNSTLSGERDRKQETITTALRFTARGKMPLMFGVGRDVSFTDKWIRGFGMGVAALDVEVIGGEAPCWL